MTSPITSQPLAGLQSPGEGLQENELEPERKKTRSCFARFCCGIWDCITGCPDNCGDCIEACLLCCDDDTGNTNRRRYNDDGHLNVWVAHNPMAGRGSAQDTDCTQPNQCTPTPNHHGSSHHDSRNHGGGGCDLGGGDTGGCGGDTGGGDCGGGGCDD